MATRALARTRNAVLTWCDVLSKLRPGWISSEQQKKDVLDSTVDRRPSLENPYCPGTKRVRMTAAL